MIESWRAGDGPDLFEVFTDDPHRVHFENRPWTQVPEAHGVYEDIDVVPIPLDDSGNPIEPGDRPWVVMHERHDAKLVAAGWSREWFWSEEILQWNAWPKARALEGVLISDRVFDTLSLIAPGCIVSERNLTNMMKASSYHLFSVLPFDAEGSQIVEETSTIRTFSTAMNRDDAFLDFGGRTNMVVTEGFRDAWLNTELSKELRADPTEQDLWFVPTNGGFRDERTFRWQ